MTSSRQWEKAAPGNITNAENMADGIVVSLARGDRDWEFVQERPVEFELQPMGDIGGTSADIYHISNF